MCNHFLTFPCDTPTIFEIDLSNIQINYMHKELLNVEVTIYLITYGIKTFYIYNTMFQYLLNKILL